MKLKEALNTKNKIHDKINSITDFQPFENMILKAKHVD